jgi:ATP-binding cassette subfamily C protein CydC
LWKLVLFVIRGERMAFLNGAVLSVAVLAMGVALLALSGWFITAAAAAGLVGMGAVFNVFAPSAMVRFLALGRTAARYGERLTTHNATLRALSNLRVRLLSGVAKAPFRKLERLRASTYLNRVTTDIDTLDGLALRLVLPGVAGLAVICAGAMAVALLVHPSVGWVIFIGHGVVPTIVFLWGQRKARAFAQQTDTALQELQTRMVDLVAVREDLIAFGQVARARAEVTTAADHHALGQSGLDHIERQTGFLLDVLGWCVVALALAVGADLAQSGQILPAHAAIAVFAALALSEPVAPVRRALTEIGRMQSATTRIAPMLAQPETEVGKPITVANAQIRARNLVFQRREGGAPVFAELDFLLRPGQTVALTGRSGGGKSTVLLMVAGQLCPSGGQVDLGGISIGDICPTVLFRHVAMVPQRHALVSGTIAENLRLAAPEATDAELWRALRATHLDTTIQAKGGLGAVLGFRGEGLSGGEARRLVLARAVLRNPQVLLLDEPTEGLDSPLASKVLAGVRQALPDAAILMAAHRPEEVGFADEVIPLCEPTGK